MPTAGGSTPSDLATLRAALDRLDEVLTAPGPRPAADMLETVAARTERLRSRLDELPQATLLTADATVIQMVSTDAEHFCAVHAPGAENSAPATSADLGDPAEVAGVTDRANLADVALRRLADSTRLLLSLLPEPTATAPAKVPLAGEGEGEFSEGNGGRRSAAGVSQAAAQEQLRDVVAEYKRDAVREERLSWLHTLLADVLAAAAVGAAVWCVYLASSQGSGASAGTTGSAAAGHGDANVWPAVLGPLIVIIVLGALALLEWRAAASARRSARECVRLQRGLASLDAYLASLPLSAQYLLRATMTQSFFQPLPEDKDPLRYTQWPDVDALAQSVMEVVDDEDDAPPEREAEDEGGGASASGSA